MKVTNGVLIGTPAALMPQQVPEAVKSERLAVLQTLLAGQQRDFNAAAVGRVMPVLFEKRGRHRGQLIGRSPYLQAVHAAAPEHLIGALVPVRLARVDTNSMAGDVMRLGEEVPA